MDRVKAISDAQKIKMKLGRDGIAVTMKKILLGLDRPNENLSFDRARTPHPGSMLISVPVVKAGKRKRGKKGKKGKKK
jgi:hypothetical protein